MLDDIFGEVGHSQALLSRQKQLSEQTGNPVHLHDRLNVLFLPQGMPCVLDTSQAIEIP